MKITIVTILSNVVKSSKINQVQNILVTKVLVVVFWFSNYQESVKVTTSDTVSFYDSLEDATFETMVEQQ
jgi:hypothetical protein